MPLIVNFYGALMSRLAARGQSITPFIEEQIGKAFIRAYNPLVDNLIEELKADAPVDTGKYRNSIKKSITGTRFDSQLVIYTNAPHAPFIEEGRKAGKRPPPDVILAWVKRKGLGKVRGGKKRGKVRTLESIQRGIAYAIGKKIGQQGLPRNTGFKPSHRLFLFRDLKVTHAAEVEGAALNLQNQVTALLNQ